MTIIAVPFNDLNPHALSENILTFSGSATLARVISLSEQVFLAIHRFAFSLKSRINREGDLASIRVSCK